MKTRLRNTLHHSVYVLSLPVSSRAFSNLFFTPNDLWKLLLSMLPMSSILLNPKANCYMTLQVAFAIAYHFFFLWASLIAQLVKNLPAYRRFQFNSWVGKMCWRRDSLPTPVFLGFPCGSAGKESACYAGDLGLIPGLGRSPGEGKGCSLQYSGLENSMDCIVHEVAKSQT